jgi:hypothetical protein
MDIFILTDSRIEGDAPGTTNRLYKNNRDGTFTEVTEKAGLQKSGWASSVCVSDYNNDGYEVDPVSRLCIPAAAVPSATSTTTVTWTF